MNLKFWQKKTIEPEVPQSEKDSESFPAVYSAHFSEQFSPTTVYGTFKTVVYVRTAVALLQDAIAQIPIEILKQDANGELTQSYNIRKAAFRKNLFSNPNPFHTYNEWMSDIIKDYCLFGNAFTSLEVDHGHAELYFLDSQEMIIHPHPRKFIDYYEYGKSGNKVVYKPLQIAHIKNRALEGPYWGQSPLEAIQKESNSLLLTNNFLYDYFRNSARPDGTLSTAMHLSPAIKDKIRAEWMRLYSAFAGKSGNIAILSNGLKYEKIQDGISDVKMGDIDQLLARRVAATFRIPMLFFANSENVNFSTSSNVIRMFYRLAVRPILSRIEDRLTKLIQNFYNDETLFVRFQLNTIPGLVEDLPDFGRFLVSIKDAGIISANEARKELNKVSRFNLPMLDGPEFDIPQPKQGGSSQSTGRPVADPQAPRAERPNPNATNSLDDVDMKDIDDFLATYS